MKYEMSLEQRDNIMGTLTEEQRHFCTMSSLEAEERCSHDSLPEKMPVHSRGR